MRRKTPMYKTISTCRQGVAFKRTFWGGAWDWTTVNVAGYWRRAAPVFSAIPDYTEYQNLFDEYKITGIKISLHPRFKNVTVAGAGAGGATPAIYQNQPYLSWAVDTMSDPSFLPAGTYSSSTYNSFLEELTSVKTRTLDRPIHIYFKPKIQTDVTQGALYTNAKLVKPGWLSLTTGTNVPMWSVQMFIHDYNFAQLDNAAFGVDVQYTYYFQCRGAN